MNWLSSLKNNWKNHWSTVCYETFWVGMYCAIAVFLWSFIFGLFGIIVSITWFLIMYVILWVPAAIQVLVKKRQIFYDD